MRSSSLRFIEPAQPTLADRPPPGTEWLHEVKFDGYRTQLAIDAGSARAYSRRGIDWTSRYPQIVAAAAGLPCASAILDGEVILPNGAGGDFHRLASTIKRHPERLVFVAFDLVHLNGVIRRAKYWTPIGGQHSMLFDIVRHACRCGAC
jgi:bifunctional non-homologous end joining protein LigD